MPFLKLLPRGGVGIEIGVNRGGYSKKIVALAAPKVLRLVDPWPTDSTDDYIKTYRVKDDMQAHYDMVQAGFAPQIAQGRIVVHRKYSRECAPLFVDGQLDFIYVDGVRSYEACLEDLRLFGPDSRVRFPDGARLLQHRHGTPQALRRDPRGVGIPRRQRLPAGPGDARKCAELHADAPPRIA